jgi:tRNA G18 (ribose-2'-O)-methylase SpoU
VIKKIEITSSDLPELRLYRSLKGKPFPFADKFFVAEGEKLVQILLRSKFVIESILLTESWFEKYRSEIESRSEALIPVYIAGESFMHSITGIELHQSIMAVAQVRQMINIQTHLSSLIDPHLIVALDGIVDAENMGGIVRNCAAFGVDLLIIGETCCSPFLRRAARVSMGGIFTVPMAHVKDLHTTLTELTNTAIVAAHIDPDNVSLADYQFDTNTCLVFGSEANGISKEILDISHTRVWIPMADGFDSLNVATSSAIFLYESRKRIVSRK